MADENKSRGDSIFEKIETWVTNTIKGFAAFLFVLIGIGALYGAYFANDPFMLIVPFIVAILAYYSRNFALIVLALIIVGILLV